jgi:UrcA family protein
MAKTSVLRRHQRKLLAALLAAHGFFAATATASPAETEATAPREVVRIGDLNLHDSRGVAAAYGRLLWAAQRVCTGADSSDYWVRESATPCLIQAVSRAVDSIGAPRLAAYALAQPLFRPR